MTSLSIAIMHTPTPERIASVERIKQALMPESKLLKGMYLITDAQRLGAWSTAKAGWKTGLGSGATHHLLIQDDVLLCKDFVGGLIRAIDSAPPVVPISPYANRKICEQAKARGDSWAIIDDGAWGQGFILPVALIPAFLEWEARNFMPECQWDDTRLSAFMMLTQRPAWVMVPSVMDHAIETVPSLLGHSTKNRARYYIGDNTSALSVDWTRGVESPLRQRASISKKHHAKWMVKAEA